MGFMVAKGLCIISFYLSFTSVPVFAQGGCPGGLADTTYDPVVLPSYPRQPGTLFKVTRVVGPGMPTEYPTPVALDLDPNTAALYVINDVLEPTARLGVQTRLLLSSQLWQSLSVIPGVNSARISANFIFRLNGKQVGGVIRRQTIASATAPLGATATQGIKRACLGIEAIRIRFARRLVDEDPFNAELPCPIEFKQTVTGNEKTCPGINELQVVVQGPYIDLLGTDGQTIQGVGTLAFLYAAELLLARNSITTSGFGSRLVFEAMAPVIMVHGIRAGPTPNYRPMVSPALQPNERSDWFESYRFSPRGTSTAFNNWFRQPFLNSKIPNTSARFVDSGLLNSLLIEPAKVYAGIAISNAVGVFGAKYCHLVGHSGGGLWSKKLIREQSSRDADNVSDYLAAFRVRSLTTVNTPHFGSLNADHVCLVNPRCVSFPADPSLIRTPSELLLSGNNYFSELMDDLRTETATAFAAQGEPPETTLGVWRHKIAYNAIWSDANLNDSCKNGPPASSPTLPLVHSGSTNCSAGNLPTITNSYDNQFFNGPDEATGYEPPDPDVDSTSIPNWFLNPFLNYYNPSELLYQQLFQSDGAALRPCDSNAEFSFGSPRSCIYFPLAPIRAPNLNDFNVTQRSALPSGYQILYGTRANHTTVGTLTTGVKVRDAIKQAEYDLTFAPIRTR